MQIDMANESSAPKMPDPIQGDAEMVVTRQKGIDIERIALANDPMTNMPVIQGTTEMLVTRQSGIMGEVPDRPGVMAADRPADTRVGVVVADQHIAADKDAGFPGHPGVVPGRPEPNQLAGPPVAGGVEAVTRVKGAVVDGVLMADQPLPSDHPTGVTGVPDVQQFTNEQLASMKKTQRSDQPAPPGAPASVHDPVAYQRQMAEASTEAHPLAKRGRPTKAETEARAAVQKGKGKSKSKKAGKAARATQPEPAPPVVDAASGAPVIDLDAEAAQAAKDAQAGS